MGPVSVCRAGQDPVWWPASLSLPSRRPTGWTDAGERGLSRSGEEGQGFDGMKEGPGIRGRLCRRPSVLSGSVDLEREGIVQPSGNQRRQRLGAGKERGRKRWGGGSCLRCSKAVSLMVVLFRFDYPLSLFQLRSVSFHVCLNDRVLPHLSYFVSVSDRMHNYVYLCACLPGYAYLYGSVFIHVSLVVSVHSTGCWFTHPLSDCVFVCANYTSWPLRKDIRQTPMTGTFPV